MSSSQNSTAAANRPRPFANIIAWCKFEDYAPFSAVGFAVETADTHELCFAPHFSRNVYPWSIIVRWDYLSEVLPQYDLPGQFKKQQETENTMEPIKIKFVKMFDDAKAPKQAHEGDAGYDLYVHSIEPIKGENAVIIHSGIRVEIPYGYQGELRARSSVHKTGAILSNGVGTIDAGYRGEVMGVFYLNGNDEPFAVGDRFAQLVIMPAPAVEYEEVEELSASERGENGYGSTGTK